MSALSLSPEMAAQAAARQAASEPCDHVHSTCFQEHEAASAPVTKSADAALESEIVAKAAASGECAICGAAFGHANICPNSSDYIAKSGDSDREARRGREMDAKRRLARRAWQKVTKDATVKWCKCPNCGHGFAVDMSANEVMAPAV